MPTTKIPEEVLALREPLNPMSAGETHPLPEDYCLYNTEEHTYLIKCFKRYVEETKDNHSNLETRISLHTDGRVIVRYAVWIPTNGEWYYGKSNVEAALTSESLRKNLKCKQLHIKLDEVEAQAEKLREDLARSCNL